MKTRYANILNVYLGASNNSVEAQVGDVVTGEVEANNCQFLQQVGFASLPPNAVPGVSASEAYIVEGSQRDTIIASRDVASQGNYGNLKAGETCLYACGSDGQAQGRVMLKATGTVSLYTTDSNAPGGNGVYLQVSPTALHFMSPWGKLVFDATGFHVSTISGARFDLGNLNNPALPSLGSFARITAGVATVDASTVQLGPSSSPLGYQSTAFALTPPVAPLTPILASGVACQAAGSSSVFIAT